MSQTPKNFEALYLREESTDFQNSYRFGCRMAYLYMEKNLKNQKMNSKN